MNPVEWLQVQLAVKLLWKRPGKTAEAIRGFQATEADGVWHLHRALARAEDPKLRAILFSHSIEELSHADEFARTYRDYSDLPFSAIQYERADLADRNAELWRAIAYVNVGEHDATERFRRIAGALPDGRLRDALARIVRDEDGHVDLTNAMLVKMGASPTEARRELFRVRLARAWQAWLRTGQRVVDSLATLLLSIAYVLLGPWLAASARRRLSSRFVEFDNSRLKKL
jgi:rubrerythrin